MAKTRFEFETVLVEVQKRLSKPQPALAVAAWVREYFQAVTGRNYRVNDVLKLKAKGLNNTHIAQELGISRQTVITVLKRNTPKKK